MKKLSLTFVLALGIALAFTGCKRNQNVLAVEVLHAEGRALHGYLLHFPGETTLILKWHL